MGESPKSRIQIGCTWEEIRVEMFNGDCSPMLEEHLTEISSNFIGKIIVNEFSGDLTGALVTCNDKEQRQEGCLGSTNEIPQYITVEQQHNNSNEGKGAKSSKLTLEQTKENLGRGTEQEQS